ncbi:ran-binding protein 10 [Nannizzia gypsea CBS 118893]|uniref:Protein FYV10 n=1 Tax=Arthroderma gypseum (strain ATCC MYA-4604 / CBS 118893) TaxID=535722 RepID=E4V035_ARTGP|nr:ran-binding protein 10 [Nannizzia gypsea CBS 118893]EFR02972.1 ran-binding protein 10 [Nannizzia gypsea CBS 118893]
MSSVPGSGSGAGTGAGTGAGSGSGTGLPAPASPYPLPTTAIPTIYRTRRSSYASVLSRQPGQAEHEHDDHFSPSAFRSSLTASSSTNNNNSHIQDPSSSRSRNQDPFSPSAIPTDPATMQQQTNGSSAGAGTAANSWRRPNVNLSFQQSQGMGMGMGQLPSYSKQFEKLLEQTDLNALPYGLNHSIYQQNPEDSFFTPSYLRSSKYVAQLYAAHKAKLSSQRDAQPQIQHTPTSGSSAQHLSSASALPLSASSSQLNLHRMAPSHRGMTYDIVESHGPGSDSAAPLEGQQLTPLPSRWNEGDKYSGLDLLGEGLEVRYIGHVPKQDHDAAAVRADQPMPVKCGLYYFEVTILAKPKDGMIGVGFSNNKASLERLPGWEQESWAYHGDDGKTFFGDNQSQGRSYGPTFTVNDTIGCGIVFSTGSAFFTKNGSFLGNAFRDLKPAKLYPCVGMRKQPGAHVRANFGQFPFIFDIDKMMEDEKYHVQRSIQMTELSTLHPTLDESEFMQKLIAQFLAHDGYVETAKIFAQEVQDEKRALQSSGEVSWKGLEVEDDIDAINRQKIRTAILEGDIDRALKLTNVHYANVLGSNPHIHFRLRCRKFIEMMRRCTEPQPATTSSSNGLSDPAKTTSGAFTLDMEVDDQMPDVETNETITASDMMDTDTSNTNNNANNEAMTMKKDQDLLHEAILYGQQLQADYPDDDKKEHKKTLDDIFSLVAYADPKTSVHGHLLDPSGRVAVAEELNSAILVSLGKSSSATLERLYQQTEALISELSEDGGAGAFINVVDDYLK